MKRQERYSWVKNLSCRIFKYFSLKIILVFILLVTPVYAQENIIIKANEISYFYSPPFIVGRGKVKMEYDGITVEADEIQINIDSSEVKGWGNISLQLNSHRIRGKKLSFNLKQKQGSIEQPSGKEGSVIFQAARARIFPDKISLDRGSFTTCNLLPPHYHVLARIIQFYPGDKIVVKNATFYLGSLPIFWTPVFIRYLTRKNRIVFPRIGYSEFTGWYIKTGYSFYSSHTEGSANLNFYQKKGLAGGVDLSYFSKKNNGNLSTYCIKEKDTGRVRGMVKLHHISSVSYRGFLKLNIDYLSDEDVIKDYFYNLPAAKKEISPSFLSCDFTGKTSSLRVIWQPNVNKFGEYPQLMPGLNVSFFKPFSGRFYLTQQTELTNFIQEKKRITRAFSSLTLSYPFTLFHFIRFKPTLGYKVFSYQRGDQNFISKSLNNQDLEFFIPLVEKTGNLTNRLSSTLGYYHSNGLGSGFPSLDYREKEAVDKNLIGLRLQNNILWKKLPVFSSKLNLSYNLSGSLKKLNPVEVEVNIPFSKGRLSTDFSYDVYDEDFIYFRSGISIYKKWWNLELNYSDYPLDSKKFVSAKTFLNLGKNLSFSGDVSYDLNLKKVEKLNYSFNLKLHCLGLKIGIRKKPQPDYNFGLYILAFSSS